MIYAPFWPELGHWEYSLGSYCVTLIYWKLLLSFFGQQLSFVSYSSWKLLSMWKLPKSGVLFAQFRLWFSSSVSSFSSSSSFSSVSLFKSIFTLYLLFFWLSSFLMIYESMDLNNSSCSSLENSYSSESDPESEGNYLSKWSSSSGGSFSMNFSM